MTKDGFLALCASMPGAAVDQPFEADFVTTVARHGDTRKWFALYMDLHGRDVVNLKCEQLRGEFWRGQFEGVTPAYHMNKQHWISVYLQSDVPDDIIEAMTWESFELTRKNTKKPKKTENA